MNIVNIYDNYNSYFDSTLKTHFKPIFEALSKVAFKSGHKLYLIGGIVRDLLLNQESLDIDIMVEGDAIEFANILEKELNVKITSIHPDFGTVKVEYKKQEIDFASTRSEIYPHAGQLPVITKIGCSLKEDVLRRDFTVNSLAMSLNKEDFADLIDFVGGFEDLKNKKMKVLHDKSFIDDPTRIIRGLKYSFRLGFELDGKTLKLQNEYLSNINYDMCYKRLKQEIIKTFTSATQSVFEAFIKQGIYKLISSDIEFLRSFELASIPDNIEKLIQKYKPKYPWLVWLGVLTQGVSVEKFAFTKYEKEVLDGAKNLLKETFSDDFDIYKSFEGQKLESLLIIAALGREKEVVHFLDNLKKVKLQINGDDLIQLGLKPSKSFSDGFDYVFKLKLENPEMTKSDELRLIQKYLN